MQSDGLHTGDVAKQDKKGNFFYIGRENDSVRVRGENISAWEIETTLNKKNFISESAILKIKAEIGEYDMIALIIPKSNILNVKQIMNNCQKDLSKNIALLLGKDAKISDFKGIIPISNSLIIKGNFSYSKTG